MSYLTTGIEETISQKEQFMTESAFHASTGSMPEPYDFNENYRYLKKLIGELRKENTESVAEQIFGGTEREKRLTKKEMKQLFRFLRKIEKHYEECSAPPIPEELEASIRKRDSRDWLPWEMEAIEKIEVWREAVKQRRNDARKMLDLVLEKVRRGEKLN
ncbi:MAG: hypothetical protein LDL33_00730 [Desulfomonile sp.]|nr:hypothetical protein [Desulfomonile sp.]